MKKVLYVITKSNWGGAQRYVFDLATSLPKGQFEVSVAFGGTGAAGAASGQLAQMLKERGIRTLFIPELGRDVSLRNDWRAYHALVTIFKKERPDIVHLNSSKVGGIGALAARVAGVPRIIFTAHGWPFWEKRNAFARAVIFCISWLTVLLSHQTICISDFDKKHMAWMPLTGKKIAVVHNGIPEIEFLQRDAAREALVGSEFAAAHAGEVWVVANGELHPNKNIVAGLEAVAAHNKRRQQKLILLVMGNGELRAGIESYIAQHGLEEQAKLLGFVPDGKRYLHAFDIFLLPSKKEGLPYALLEAAQALLPVVASNVGGIPELIQNNVSGLLVDPTNIDGFTRALDTLVAQTELRDKMGKKLYQTVMKEFTFEHMLEQTVALYKS